MSAGPGEHNTSHPTTPRQQITNAQECTPCNYHHFFLPLPFPFVGPDSFDMTLPALLDVEVDDLVPFLTISSCLFCELGKKGLG